MIGVLLHWVAASSGFERLPGMELNDLSQSDQVGAPSRKDRRRNTRSSHNEGSDGQLQIKVDDLSAELAHVRAQSDESSQELSRLLAEYSQLSSSERASQRRAVLAETTAQESSEELERTAALLSEARAAEAKLMAKLDSASRDSIDKDAEIERLIQTGTESAARVLLLEGELTTATLDLERERSASTAEIASLMVELAEVKQAASVLLSEHADACSALSARAEKAESDAIAQATEAEGRLPLLEATLDQVRLAKDVQLQTAYEHVEAAERDVAEKACQLTRLEAELAASHEALSAKDAELSAVILSAESEARAQAATASAAIAASAVEIADLRKSLLEVSSAQSESTSSILRLEETLVAARAVQTNLRTDLESALSVAAAKDAEIACLRESSDVCLEETKRAASARQIELLSAVEQSEAAKNEALEKMAGLSVELNAAQEASAQFQSVLESKESEARDKEAQIVSLQRGASESSIQSARLQEELTAARATVSAREQELRAAIGRSEIAAAALDRSSQELNSCEVKLQEAQTARDSEALQYRAAIDDAKLKDVQELANAIKAVRDSSGGSKEIEDLKAVIDKMEIAGDSIPDYHNPLIEAARLTYSGGAWYDWKTYVLAVVSLALIGSLGLFFFKRTRVNNANSIRVEVV